MKIRALLLLPFLLLPFFLPNGLHATDVLYIYGDVSDDGDIPSGDKKPFHQMRLDDPGRLGLSQFKDAIEKTGLTISEAYDADLRLTPEFLATYRVLILGSNQRRFSADEAAALDRWVRDGGGVVAWSDSAFGGLHSKVGMGNTKGLNSDNDLTRQFGMQFLRDNGAGNYLISQYTRPHFLNRNRANGGIRFRGEGVSCVRVSPPAEILAPLQDGGLGGGIRLNKEDGDLIPERDAALAIAEVGKGRVVGVFDRNTYWNQGEGTQLSHEDNREFAQRIILWAAAREEKLP